MEFPKQIKDTVYRLLQEPTLDHFREFLQDQTGEHNAIDFKQEWIEKDKLAKLMLALANYGGGIVVFGVHENDDKTFSCDGFMIKLQLIQIAKLMFLQHQMRSRTVLSNWKANTQQLSQR